MDMFAKLAAKVHRESTERVNCQTLDRLNPESANSEPIHS